MNVREKLRQRTIAAESKDQTRRTQDVARDKSKRRDRGSSQENRSAQIPKKNRCSFGQRRARMVRKIGAERALPYDLDQGVNDRRNDKREVRGARNRTRGIFHLAAGNQRHFDSNESENQQDNGVAYRLA